MKDINSAVNIFQEKVLGIPLPEKPTRLSAPRKDWAITALEEELEEFISAETIEDEIDALCDIMYFASGRFYEMGVDANAELAEVQKANMKKVRGELSKRPNSQGYDAIKPAGWMPPVVQLKSLRKPKLLVLGHAGHGKDEFCEILNARYGWAYTKSSMYCAQKIVFPIMKNHFNYATALECYNKRNNHRGTWRRLIREYLQHDKARIGRPLLQRDDIYCGVRDPLELEACRKHADLVVWIEARERIGGTEETNQTEAYMADVVIDNNGTKADLLSKIDNFVVGVHKNA